MRVGLIARSNSRGLGTQTTEAYYGYPFDSVLHVLDGNPAWPEEPDRFPGAHIAHLRDGKLADADVVPFLNEVDVVFSVETLYDWRLVKLAAQRNVRTIVQGNPEFYRHGKTLEGQPTPDLWVWPTEWMIEQMPTQVVVPVPCAVDCPAKPAPLDSPFVVVHVAGHRAAGDRNGTELMIQALPLIRADVTVRIVGQDGIGTVLRERVPRMRGNVSLEVVETGMENRWDLYDGAHCVVLPRRYGGLCLPAQEAIQAGVVPLMPNVVPNTRWPIIPLHAKQGRAQLTPFGYVPTWMTPPVIISKTIDQLSRDRDRVAIGRLRGQEWVEANSWPRLQPVYDDLFGK